MRVATRLWKNGTFVLGLVVVVLLGMGNARAIEQAPEFPLKVSENHRYLVDQKGVPFLYHADTAWQMLWKLTKADTEQYLNNRKQKGFTAIQVQLLPHRVHQTNRDGQNPFLSPGDFSRPNPAYFEHADWAVRKAGEMGLCVMLAPNWLSEWEQDWRRYLTNENAEKWGRYLGNRYQSFKHVMWMHGGDVDPKDLIDETRQVAAGIEATARDQLQTYHAGCKSSSIFFHNDAWLDWNTAYDYGNIYPQVYEDYKRSPTKPVYLGESHYENNNNGKTAYDVRKQAYWAMLAGCAGHAYGHGSIWQFAKDWVSGMDAPGAWHMAHLKNVFASREWHKLMPDMEHTAVTKGYGDGETYAAAARANDGNSAVVYLPTARPITLDMTKFRGKLVAKWFDPTSGGYAEVSGSPFDNSGSRDFTPPGKNHAGDADWVLVLETQAQR